MSLDDIIYELLELLNIDDDNVKFEFLPLLKRKDKHYGRYFVDINYAFWSGRTDIENTFSYCLFMKKSDFLYVVMDDGERPYCENIHRTAVELWLK